MLLALDLVRRSVHLKSYPHGLARGAHTEELSAAISIKAQVHRKDSNFDRLTSLMESPKAEQLSFSGARATQQSRGGMLFLALTLFLPTAIVVSNFVIGILTPITWSPEDDLSLIDSVWRLVQGQHLGADFHDPRGFGLFQVAAMVWHLVGPHYYVLPAAAALFALAIVFCAYVVATRRLRDVAGLAALFCITVAFAASAPSNYGKSAEFGMALIYDRLLVSGLLVLFVQSFVNDLDVRQEGAYIDLCCVAFLLNILFLIKISGLVLGLAIVAGGFFVIGRLVQGLAAFSLILVLLSAMITIDFTITGTNLSPVIQEYKLAAQAKMESYSVIDGLWFASRLAVFGAVVLMVLYAISRPHWESKGRLWRCLLIIAFFWVCQVALNMSNYYDDHSAAVIYLAPAAAVAIVISTDASATTIFWGRLLSRFHARRLNEIEIPAREGIPMLFFALIIAPALLTSLRAVKLDYSILSGTVKPISVTANKGIKFEILPKYSYNIHLALSFNRAIQAIENLGATGDKIANLDFINPFPALFLAPAPKGISVWWDFNKHHRNVPIGYRLNWQEIIGDACIVTEEDNPDWRAEHTGPLVDVVQPHLTSQFILVYQDELWKIWKKRNGCDENGQ